MRIQTRSLIAALVLVSFCCGFTGCKSRGTGGPWYKPSSYTWYNPFKGSPEDDEYGMYANDESESLPRNGLSPEISAPREGYGNDRSAERVAMNQNGQSYDASRTGQYPNSNAYTANSRVAGTNPSAGVQPASYDPNYGYTANRTPAPATNPGYNTAGSHVNPNPAYGTQPNPNYQPNQGNPAYAQPYSPNNAQPASGYAGYNNAATYPNNPNANQGNFDGTANHYMNAPYNPTTTNTGATQNRTGYYDEYRPGSGTF